MYQQYTLSAGDVHALQGMQMVIPPPASSAALITSRLGSTVTRWNLSGICSNVVSSKCSGTLPPLAEIEILNLLVRIFVWSVASR